MRRFFDTNVLVYQFDRAEPRKRDHADRLTSEAIRAGTMVISTQVMQEFFRVSTKKLAHPLSIAQAVEALGLWLDGEVVPTTPELVVEAIELTELHRLAWWDALIIQAAIAAECDVLFSEDLQHGRRFGALRIENPFLGFGVHEPALAGYTP